MHSDGDYEFDMVSLTRVAWAHKLLVAAIVVVAGIIAVVLVVTVVEDNHMGGGLESIANQFGGLASLAGVSLGTGGPEREYRAVLESRHLVEEFVKRNGVVPLLQPNAKQPPRVWVAVEKFKKSVLKIDEDKVKGITTVSMDWTDPVVATRWANGFIALANELVRNRALADSSRNIEYLNKQVAQTNVVELQRVMYNLIQSETKTLMLANARAEYAFSVVDPAVVPEMRVSPKRTLMVISGLVVGLAVGVLIAWIRNKFVAHRTVADTGLS
jgi:uncharacterized protein involved in exopolysaccharide biosynthesis